MADQTRGDSDGSRHSPMTGKIIPKQTIDKVAIEAERKKVRDAALVRALENLHRVAS